MAKQSQQKAFTDTDDHNLLPELHCIPQAISSTCGTLQIDRSTLLVWRASGTALRRQGVWQECGTKMWHKSANIHTTTMHPHIFWFL